MLPEPTTISNSPETCEEVTHSFLSEAFPPGFHDNMYPSPPLAVRPSHTGSSAILLPSAKCRQFSGQGLGLPFPVYLHSLIQSQYLNKNVNYWCTNDSNISSDMISESQSPAMTSLLKYLFKVITKSACLKQRVMASSQITFSPS